MTETVRSSTIERTAPAPGASDRARRLAHLLLQGERPYMLYVAFAILLVIFSLASPWFLSLDNFLNIGRQTALVSIIAVGMTFVIIARQIDLSVGSTLALSGMCAALAMAHVSDNWLVGAVAGIGTGALVGLINGLLTTRLGDSFVPGDAGNAERRARAGLDAHQHQARHRHQRNLFYDIRRGLPGRNTGADRMDAAGLDRRDPAAPLQHLRPADLRGRRQSDRGALLRNTRSARHHPGLCPYRNARGPRGARAVRQIACGAPRRRARNGDSTSSPP